MDNDEEKKENENLEAVIDRVRQKWEIWERLRRRPVREEERAWGYGKKYEMDRL